MRYCICSHDAACSQEDSLPSPTQAGILMAAKHLTPSIYLCSVCVCVGKKHGCLLSNCSKIATSIALYRSSLAIHILVERCSTKVTSLLSCYGHLNSCTLRGYTLRYWVCQPTTSLHCKQWRSARKMRLRELRECRSIPAQ